LKEEERRGRREGMAGEDRDKVLVEIEAEGLKLHYIFEKEFAEHLKRKQEHPLKILRKVSKEEAQKWEEFLERLDNEIFSYYDEDREESGSKERMLVEARVGDIKQHYVIERDFAEYLKRKQYPIEIIRRATKEEWQKGLEVEAWLYDEAFHYYD